MERKIIFCADGFDPQRWSASNNRTYTWVIDGAFMQWNTDAEFQSYSSAMNDAIDNVRNEHPEFIESSESVGIGFSIIILDYATLEKMTVTRFGRVSQGRPAEMDGGKRVNVYLDSESQNVASSIGNGNVSDGIRVALAKFSKK